MIRLVIVSAVLLSGCGNEHTEAPLGFLRLGAPQVVYSGFPFRLDVAAVNRAGDVVAVDSLASLSIVSGPPSSTLSGQTRAPLRAGAYSGSDFTLDRWGSYTLAADMPGWTRDTIAVLVRGVPVFSVQPHDVVAGALFWPAVEVELRDVTGDLDVETATEIDISDVCVDLVCPIVGRANAVGGKASFPDMAVTRAGTAHVLHAWDTSLISPAHPYQGVLEAYSLPFDVTPAAPEQLGRLRREYLC